ncbi:MAG: hypothetical protein AAFQ68_02875 [Bacteroidota bacterium]
MKAPEHRNRIQHLSDLELAEMLDQPTDYQPEILQLAEEEVNRREFDPEDWQALLQQARDKRNAVYQIHQAERAGIVRPFQHFIQERGPRLLIACLMLGIIIALRLPETISLLQFVSEKGLDWDASTYAIVLPTILLAIGMLGLLFRQNWAWSLSTLMVAYLATSLLILLVFELFFYKASFLDVFFVGDSNSRRIAVGIQLIPHLAALIVLFLEEVRLKLSLKSWQLWLWPILGTLISLALYGDMLNALEEPRISAPVEQQILTPLDPNK